jgi:hypothetical protein
LLDGLVVGIWIDLMYFVVLFLAIELLFYCGLRAFIVLRLSHVDLRTAVTAPAVHQPRRTMKWMEIY